MAIHASPGVYYEIKDYSTYANELTTTTLALVGKTVKGPTVPTFISSVRQFTETYGYPRKTDYSALAAISYLEYGNALWFRRIIGADATKAGNGIPTANPIFKEENVVSVDGDNGYVLSNSGNELNSVLPGTVCVEIRKDGYSTSYVRDNGEGIFDSNKYTFLSDTVNYVNYSNGDFRFTLKNSKVDEKDFPLNKETEKLYVKYITNIFEKEAPADIQEETSGTTFNNTNNPLDVDSYHCSIKSSSFIMRVFSNNENYIITCGDKDKIGENEKATLVCDNSNFKSGELDLVKGVWTITFKNSVANPLITVDNYVVEQYKYKVLPVDTIEGKEYSRRHYTDTVNVPVYKNGFYIYKISNTVTEDKLYLSMANDNKAIAKDDGFNSIIGDAVSNAMNKVDYNTGKISLVCAFEPEDRVYDVTATAKFVNTVGTTKNGTVTYKYNFDCALIKNSVSILIGNTVSLTDNGNGDLINNEGKTMGSIIYHQKSLTDGKIKGSLEFDYNSAIFDKAFNNKTELDAEFAKNPTDFVEGKKYYTISDDKTYQVKKSSSPKVLESTTTTYNSNQVIKVSYLKEIGYVESRNYGEADNGLTLEFFAEDFKDSSIGYFGLKLWNADTYTNTTPTETFRKFTFGDSEKATYFTNKAVSTYVTFDLYDENVIPVVNFPIVLSGGYSDADNITENSAVMAFNDFNNPETYDINLIACPDYPGDKTITAALFELCENTRGDCFCVVDPPKGLTVQNVVAWHNGDGIYANENALTSRHGALYYPWIKISNEFTESLQFVPPSVKVLSVYAYSDNNADVWYAPAGLNRGKIFAAVALERQLTVSDRDLLYATNTNAINPICDFPSDGIAIWGQKTLQREPSALDRVNVMRMVLYVTKVLATATKYLLFEPHDPTTWEQYTMLVEPFLENIKNRRGLTDYLVKCDSTTNTASDLDNNTMVAEVSLKPTKSTERIITRFKITGAGASLNNLTTSA